LVVTKLLQVESAWKFWDRRKKCEACTSLHDLIDFMDTVKGKVPIASVAWDISPPLYEIGTGTFKWGHPYPAPGSPAGPPNYYDRTVVFREKCYLAGSVNYALWGKINKLCYSAGFSDSNTFSLASALFLVTTWKKLVYPDDGGRAVDQAKAFTTFGFNETLPSCKPITATRDLDNKIDPTAGDWVWLPNHPQVPAGKWVGKYCK
jgi:hypothetical protein